MKRFIPLVLIVLCAAFVGGVGAIAVVKTGPVARLGPFYTSSAAWDSATGLQPGGRVIYFISADSEKIGDVVYISSVNHVSKSATIANYNAVAGVVVGGARVSMLASIQAADVGTLAATANQRVIVLRQGRTWVKADAADSLRAGALIQPSTTVAGAAMNKGSALDSLYRVIGKMVTTGAASATALAEINVR